MSVFTKKERIDGYLKRKFLFLIILLIAVISQTLLAQAPDTLWTKIIGQAGIDHASSIQQTAEGGYIVSGYTFSFGAGKSDVYLIKTNASGNTLWTKTIGSSLYEKSFSVQQTTDKGYIVSGWKDISNGNDEVFLIKLDIDPTKIGDGLINHVPHNIALYQNYPNPFNPETVIEYQIPRLLEHSGNPDLSGGGARGGLSLVQLDIFNTLGQKVATLVNEKHPAGSYSVEFNGQNLPSGVYFYRINAGSFSAVRKMILLK